MRISTFFNPRETFGVLCLPCHQLTSFLIDKQICLLLVDEIVAAGVGEGYSHLFSFVSPPPSPCVSGYPHLSTQMIPEISASKACAHSF